MLREYFSLILVAVCDHVGSGPEKHAIQVEDEPEEEEDSADEKEEKDEEKKDDKKEEL